MRLLERGGRTSPHKRTENDSSILCDQSLCPDSSYIHQPPRRDQVQDPRAHSKGTLVMVHRWRDNS